MLQVVCPTCYFSISLKKGKNTSWIRLKYQKVTNSEQRFRNVLLVIPSLRNGRTQSAWPCWPDPAGSHSDQCYCRGYDHWHFLLAGNMNTLPWPLSLFFSVCLFLFLSLFFFVFLFALLLSAIILGNVEPASNLLLSVWVCLYLDSPTSSLQFLSQHLSLLSDSASPRYFLCLHASSSFCSLPVSKPLNPYHSLLPALPLVFAFQIIPPSSSSFPFSLIHNKTIHRCLYYFKPRVQPFLFHFALRISQQQHLRQICW